MGRRWKSDFGRSRSRRGFSLLEVLVALSVLAMGVTALLQVTSGALKLIGKSEAHIGAVITGEAKLRDILDRQGLSEGAWSETGRDGTRMDVAVTETLKERAQLLPARMLHARVTVYWREGPKEKRTTLDGMKLIVDKPAVGNET